MILPANFRKAPRLRIVDGLSESTNNVLLDRLVLVIQATLNTTTAICIQRHTTPTDAPGCRGSHGGDQDGTNSRSCSQFRPADGRLWFISACMQWSRFWGEDAPPQENICWRCRRNLTNFSTFFSTLGQILFLSLQRAKHGSCRC